MKQQCRNAHEQSREAKALNRFGFGLEALGIAVVRWRRPFAVAALAVFAVLISAIPTLRFDGNTLNLIAEDSELYRNYREIGRDFRDPAGDLVAIVRSDGLYTREKFEALRELHLELTIAEGVSGVVSPFTSSRFDRQTGSFVSTIPDDIGGDIDIAALIRDAGDVDPLISLTSQPDRDAAMIYIETTLKSDTPDAEQFELIETLTREVRALAPADFRIDFAGQVLFRADAVEALVQDQVKLTLIGLGLAVLIAFVTFRAPLPALVCTAPAVMATLSVLGAFALSGTEVTYLSTTLPTIAMVLALADTIMLYFSWVGFRRDGLDVEQAVERAVRRVGPATALTSVTTALAFGSFIFAGNHALRELALLGSSAVAVAFVTVMVLLPLLLLAFGHRINPQAKRSAFAAVGGWTARFARWRPATTSVLALLAAISFSGGHIFGEVAYLTLDKVPADSRSAQGEKLAVDLFGGVTPVYLTVPVAQGRNWYDAEALAELGKAESTLSQAIAGARSFSLAGLAAEGADPLTLRDAMEDAPDNIRGRFLSRDGTRYLVTGSVPYDVRPDEARRLTEDVARSLAADGIDDVHVTGYSLMAAVEIPAIVAALKQSLIIAIFIGVFVVALVTASPLVAVAALIPNLTPVLFIETGLWLLDIPMDVPHVIALTIAFGISIDNAIHLINVYLANRREGMAPDIAMTAALGEVAPALVSATAMFVAGSMGTLLSVLPAVANLGFLIIATLAVALISNLALLPALILTCRRFIPETILIRQTKEDQN